MTDTKITFIETIHEYIPTPEEIAEMNETGWEDEPQPEYLEPGDEAFYCSWGIGSGKGW